MNNKKNIFFLFLVCCVFTFVVLLGYSFIHYWVSNNSFLGSSVWLNLIIFDVFLKEFALSQKYILQEYYARQML